jgi:hypothetical protein
MSPALTKPAAAGPEVYGSLAEFSDAEHLVAAAKAARAAGYKVLEAYTPFPMHELFELLGHRNRLPLLVLCGGLVGALGGLGMQWYSASIDYPINVGGRPLASWPAFMVPAFEMCILAAALTAVIGMFALSGLPQPYHPVFHAQRFEKASRHRFFLMILARDPLFERGAARELLEKHGGVVEEVPP